MHVLQQVPATFRSQFEIKHVDLPCLYAVKIRFGITLKSGEPGLLMLVREIHIHQEKHPGFCITINIARFSWK
jgi:hypothetical protein